jgi:AcrR family transcriptional regulator
VTLPEEFVEVRVRARPMAPEERRAHILDAVIPLLMSRGRDVSSKEMAAAAGIAEGTLFRAFGDKDAIIEAAVIRYWDPAPFRDRMRAIDPDEPTEEKVRQLVQLFVDRFEGVIGFMSALRLQDGPPPREHEPEDESSTMWFPIVENMFRPDELSVPPRQLGYLLRLVAFGTAIPDFNAAHRFSVDELTSLVLHGVAAAPDHAATDHRSTDHRSADHPATPET